MFTLSALSGDHLMIAFPGSVRMEVMASEHSAS